MYPIVCLDVYLVRWKVYSEISTSYLIASYSCSHFGYALCPRFPVVTWRHPRTKAVLLRASGFHGKGVMGMLKGHHAQPTGTTGSTSNATQLTQ